MKAVRLREVVRGYLKNQTKRRLMVRSYMGLAQSLKTLGQRAGRYEVIIRAKFPEIYILLSDKCGRQHSHDRSDPAKVRGRFTATVFHNDRSDDVSPSIGAESSSASCGRLNN